MNLLAQAKQSIWSKLIRKYLRPYFVLGLIVTMGVTVGLSAVTKSSFPIVMYGVHDAGGSDSQFFSLELDSGNYSALGNSHDGYDIEAVGLQPNSCDIYAISGGGGSQDGKLYLVDKTSGGVSVIGETGAAGSYEIQAASFHPGGALWAAQQSVGLVTVSLADAALTVELADSENDWEGLAWDLSGTYLYGAEKSRLYRFDPTDDSVTEICDNLPNPTEALEFAPDGALMGGQHNGSALKLYSVDLGSCGISSVDYNLPYNDIESLVFERCETEINQCADNQAPIARINPPQIEAVVGQTVSFSGNNSSDADGSDLTYHWTVAELGLEGESEDFSFVVNAIGKYTVELTVKDQCGTQHTTQALVIVGAEDACELTLTKTAFPDVVAPGGQLEYAITVTNTGTADCTGGGVELNEHYDPQTTFVSSDPAPFSGNKKWNFGTMEPGETHNVAIVVKVSASADDGDVIKNEACIWSREYGLPGEAESWLCVTAETPVEEENICVGNETPTPVISPFNPTITLGQTVDFSSAQSSDPENNSLTFLWAVNQLNILSTTTNFSFTPPSVGEYIVTLKVADGCSWAVVWTTVTVKEPEICLGNVAPEAIINPLNPNILISETVNFTAESSSDQENDTLEYSWSVEGQGQTANTVGFEFIPSASGQYTVTLRVSDQCGFDITSTEANVAENNACLGHEAPQPAIGPMNPSITLGNAVNFTSSGSSDPDGDAIEFKWFVDGELVSEQPNFQYTPAQSGIYDIKLTATDTCGSASVETTLIVNNQPGNGQCVGNTLPVAKAGDDKAVMVGVSLTLDGSASTDADGDTLTYTWEVPSINHISQGVTTTVSFDSPNPEKRQAILTVSDQCGSSADSVEINVHAGGGGGGGPQCPGLKPAAVAGANISALTGQAFTLDGTGSQDPEGDILTFLWKIQAVNFQAQTATTSASISQPGKYIAELTVGDGCDSDIDTLEIEIVNPGGGGGGGGSTPPPPASPPSGGGGGGGGSIPPPSSPPVTFTPPINNQVLGTTTPTFNPPVSSPRAGNGFPTTELFIGILSGAITSIGAYLITRKKEKMLAFN